MTDRMPLLLALCDLLDAENDALSRSDTRTTARLLDEKNRLVRRLRSEPAAGDAGGDPVPSGVARRLSTSLRLNGALLERALLVQRRMIGTIVAAARAPSGSTGYRATGRHARTSVAAIALMKRA